jgi:signal transduction histidine kinase
MGVDDSASPGNNETALRRPVDQGAGSGLDNPSATTERALHAVSRRLRVLLPTGRLKGRGRAVFSGAMILCVLLVLLIDKVSGPGEVISLDVLYVVPPILATVYVSATWGLAIAIEAATGWVLLDASEPPRPSLGTSIADALLRIVILGAFVILVSALRDAVAESRQSDLRSKEFLGYAAHQIRTPLAALQSCTDSLVMSGAGQEQEELLGHISAESGRIGKLVRSLLQIARMDEEASFPLRCVNLGDVCEQAIQRAGDRDRRQLLLEGPERSGLPGTMMANPDALNAVLDNLLDNSLRHALHAVNLDVSTLGSDVEIRVSDDGPGLPPGTEERVFERFVSLDSKGGAGLGLSIARDLIEGQGGRLFYEQNRFVIRLPLTVPD